MKVIRITLFITLLAAISYLFGSEYVRQSTAREKEEQSMLWKALEEGNIVSAVELLQAGVNPNARGNYFLTVLEYAARKGYQEVVAELLRNPIIPLSTEQEFAAINEAISHNQYEIVKLLLESGVDPDIQDEIFLYTPLMLAIMVNKPAIAQLFLEYGAKTGVTNIQGQTALEFARENDAKEIIALIEDFEQKRMA
ncbi:MAG: ankyrin repeat domain-containing protein [Candidatus Babeliales bacterium]